MNRQIAEDFSNGRFSATYDHLDEQVEWHVFGEKILKGKEQVIADCEQTANYFKTVTTRFQMYNIIESADRVVINGKAEFSRQHKTLALVNACDVYEFRDERIWKIYSYCITQKTND